MIRHLRFVVATAWVATLVLVAAVVLGLSTGSGTAGARPVILQPPAANAATSRAANAASAPVTDGTTTSTSTTVAPTTVAPTTVAPTTVAPVTAPPTTARTTPPPPPTVAPTVARPPVTAPPATAAPVAASSGGGSASDFSLIGYRWSPCQVVTFSSSGPDISGVVAELASITGLHLQVVSGAAEVTVSWGSVPAGGEIGETAWRAVGGWLTGGTIVLSSAAGPYMATVLRHELAHSLGLGHAASSNEIMYPIAGPGSPTDYQAGDLAGLRAVGASSGGC